MAKVNEVTVRVQRTIQVNQFEPAVAEVVFTLTPTAKEDVDAILAEYREKALSSVEETLRIKRTPAPTDKNEVEDKAASVSDDEIPGEQEEERLSRRSAGLKRKAAQADKKVAEKKAAPVSDDEIPGDETSVDDSPTEGPVEETKSAEPAGRTLPKELDDIQAIRRIIGEAAGQGTIEATGPRSVRALLRTKQFPHKDGSGEPALKLSNVDPAQWLELLDALGVPLPGETADDDGLGDALD